MAATAASIIGLPLNAQTTRDPLPATITADDATVVGVVEFASLPDVQGNAVRMMRLVDEPGTARLFVNGMRGAIFGVSYDGRSVVEYVNIDDPRWGVSVESSGRERGFQSFAFHPDFGNPGTPGYGHFYTWTDTDDTAPPPDFGPRGEGDSHDTVLLEWIAEDPAANAYDGGPPRELMRFQQPYGNHNAGHLAFDPTATSGSESGLLYIGVADGGSGGDPQNMSQDLSSGFGKVFRIDPLGASSANGQYGIPASNPFVDRPGAIGEVYAYGVRNPQRFGWDPNTRRMFLADIGQNTIEEISPVAAGANLGWNVWEGSFRFVGREGVDASAVRSDPAMTYPVAEYAHGDPLLTNRAAATGVLVYRSSAVPQLTDRVLFGDFPSGEIFHFDADDPPDGGNQGFRRVLLRDGGAEKTFLQLLQEKNREQGREPAGRTDLRIDGGPDGQIFLLNKHDGTIRRIVP
jgi:glucose/arabinose dehydrogenase